MKAFLTPLKIRNKAKLMRSPLPNKVGVPSDSVELRAAKRFVGWLVHNLMWIVMYLYSGRFLVYAALFEYVCKHQDPFNPILVAADVFKDASILEDMSEICIYVGFALLIFSAIMLGMYFDIPTRMRQRICKDTSRFT